MIRKCSPIGKEPKNMGRIKRTLDLILFLSTWRTIGECALHIQVSERSIQRYFQLLMHLGFELEKHTGRFYAYRITNIKDFFGIKETE